MWFIYTLPFKSSAGGFLAHAWSCLGGYVFWKIEHSWYSTVGCTRCSTLTAWTHVNTPNADIERLTFPFLLLLNLLLVSLLFLLLLFLQLLEEFALFALSLLFFLWGWKGRQQRWIQHYIDIWISEASKWSNACWNPVVHLQLMVSAVKSLLMCMK